MVGEDDFDETTTVKGGLEIASNQGLDLMLVAPQGKPPVCKLLDYGKFRYEAQKKVREARKNQKVIQLKEVKMRPNIDENDYNIKIRNARRFIDDGNKVKLTLRFRGREMAHQDIARALMDRVKASMEDVAKVEFEPKLEGRQMIMILAPQK